MLPFLNLACDEDVEWQLASHELFPSRQPGHLDEVLLSQLGMTILWQYNV
jgi:hypothetical protein